MDTPSVPFVEWEAFLAKWKWVQGEHVTLVGPTGSGKTTLALAILPLRRYTVVFASKPRDPLMDTLKKTGFKVSRTWPVVGAPMTHEKIVFWPPMVKPQDRDTQREGFRLALTDVFRSGGWALYVDEIRYLSDTLKLRDYLELLWLQGRSLGVSLIGGTQRPAWIPLEAYSQATHLFLWRDNDERNLKRLQGLGAINGRELRRAVETLSPHEVLYADTRRGTLLRTKVR